MKKYIVTVKNSVRLKILIAKIVSYFDVITFNTIADFLDLCEYINLKIKNL